MGRLWALRLTAACLLLGTAWPPGAAAAAAGRDTAAAVGRAPARRSLRGIYCNPASADALKPIPCTPEQEQSSLDDLAADTPSSTDPVHAVIDTSACSAADPGGYTQVVDLFDFDMLEVATSIGDEFVNAQPPDSVWQAGCAGADITVDPYNACRQPGDGTAEEPGVHYRLDLKLSGCSDLASDTIALEAYAFLLRQDGNDTVLVTDLRQIPLPGAGQ